MPSEASIASVAALPKSNRSPGSRKTTSSSSTSRNAGSSPCEARRANALSAARKAARSSRRSRCASGLALHVRARSSPSMALGRLSGEPPHGVQRCPPMSGGDRYASTNRDNGAANGRGRATGGLASRDGERRSEEHTSELQSRLHLVCRLLLEKKKQDRISTKKTWHPTHELSNSHRVT